MENELKVIERKFGLQLTNGKEVTVSSRIIADKFSKGHNSVLKAIEGENRKGEHINGLIDNILASGNPPTKYFIETTYINRGKDYKEYLLTRDGYTLLVMGFKGQKALEIKLKYIEAFNKMENYIKNQNQLIQNNQTMFLAQNMQQMATTMAQFMQNSTMQLQQIKKETKSEVKEIVKDSIISKDLQIDKMSNMIGLRAKNTMSLVSYLKEKLSDLLGYKLTAKDHVYIKIKNKVFREFHVCNWEDIPINQFSSVYAYIDNLEKEDIGIAC